MEKISFDKIKCFFIFIIFITYTYYSFICFFAFKHDNPAIILIYS